MASDIDLSGTSIYDEIYGYIDVTDLELLLIDTPLFQRLNHIKQLGMSYRVFPGSHHTRFSHSLGVLFLIDKMATQLDLPVEDRKILRIAALLHDIGHYPFSHVLEVVFTDHNKREDAKHEKYSAHIINNTSIKDVLSQNYSDNEVLKISSIIQGTSDNPLFNQLISSDLDADRLDYLIRDSSHTGVTYGNIDLNRIIHTLDLDDQNYLSIKEGGKHAAEGYIVGRYLMWATVYTHKTTCGFEDMVQHIYQLIKEEEYSSYEALLKLPEEKIIKFDDSYILSKIHEYCISDKENYLSTLCKMFIKREHLCVVKEGMKLYDDEDSSKLYYNLDAFQHETQMDVLCKQSGVEKKWIFHNNSSTHLPTLYPILESILSGDKVSEREMQKILRIKKPDGSSNPLINDKTSLVHNLQGNTLDIVRIYSKECDMKKVSDGIEKCWK